MKLGTKHNGTRIVHFTDFSGGLNHTLPPEALAENECVVLLNWEYDFSSGVLKTRDGTKKLASLGSNIDQLFYAKNLDLLLVSSGTKLYKYNFDGTFTELGNLSGDKIPVFVEWGNKVLIASGGNLQSTNGSALTTIDTSPVCDYVNVQYGRVIVSKQGDDYLYWSGIGDETNWNFEGTDSDAIKLEVGYKDGGNIIAVKMLSKDVIVFKDNRRIYRVVGVYPNWAVYQVSEDSGLLSRLAAVEVGNLIIFMDRGGMRSLNTVFEYGDIKVRDIGEKVNRWLKEFTPEAVRIWHVKPKGQAWVRIKNSEFVYVFHYYNGAWTAFKFPKKCCAVTWIENTVYLALENELYRMDSTLTDDDGEDIQARLITKRIHPSRQFLLKKGKMFYQGISLGTMNLKINKLNKNLDLMPSGDIAYYDDDIAYYDDDPVCQQESSLVQFKCNHRIPYLQPELTVQSGSIKLLGLILEVVEV